MSPDNLDRDAWAAAGLLALEEDGVTGVTGAGVARRLGVTRGSFYWHFASRDDLLAAVLQTWEREHSDDLLDALERIEDPRARLRALVDASTGKPASIFIRLLDAADSEPLVADTLRRSADRRLAVIARACRETGLAPAEARRRALLMYAAYVGLAQLQRDDPGRMKEAEQRAYARHAAATLIP